MPSPVLKLGSKLVLAAALFSAPLVAQDGRGTVAEPIFPTVCTTLTATQTIVSGEPSGETTSNTAPDTARIQAALNACPSGQAVELALSGSQTAFLAGAFYTPSGRTLIVDGGVTLFGSRNPADYQIPSYASQTTPELCGTVGPTGNACYPFLTVGEGSLGASNSSTGSNIMGFGVINGRGGDKLIINGAVTSNSWWDLANTARSGGSQNNPILLQLYKDNSSALYKITLLNSPHFHVKNNYSTNWTVWGVKVSTPWTARNTDGIDPSGTTNVTITNSVIGDGDDEIAIGGSSAATAFTFSNLNLISGHGISIGSYTNAGVSNVLANGLYFQGQAADTNQNALHIKSAMDRGGLVQNIAYENVCIQNVYQAIQLDPFYDTTSGTEYPSYKNITYANVHVLASSVTPHVEIAGYSSSYLSTVTMDNVVFDSAPSFSPVWQNATITFSDAISGTSTPQVYPASLASNTGTGVTYTNTPTISNANAFNCTGKFPLLVGELYAGTATVSNNVNTVAITNPATLTLNAVLEPTNTETTYSYVNGSTTYTNAATVAAVPTGSIQFLDNGKVIATQSLGANGTLASYSVTNPTAGPHTYTANFVGDSNYAMQAFGTLAATVTAGPAAELGFTAAPPASLTYGTAPGTVSVSVEDVSGSPVSSAASVSLTISNSTTGYSNTLSTTASSGVATFSLPSSLPSVGTFSYLAQSSGLTSASASESVTAATLTVAAQAASRIFGAPNPLFGYSISGFVNNDPSSVVSGAPTLTTTALRDSSAGSYPITAAAGTLAAANYVFATSGSTLTVNGGAPQAILFTALPNFVHGNTYQLSARTTSGLPATYTVTGPASVSGSSLQVTGTGTVTVTAASAANTNYAAAASVAQTFTAQ
jgi:polygalacturonase